MRLAVILAILMVAGGALYVRLRWLVPFVARLPGDDWAFGALLRCGCARGRVDDATRHLEAG
jgi:hypothetical protein